MGLKKTISIILMLIVLVCCAVTVNAEQSQILTLGRIDVNMPQITVEIKGSGYDENSIVASLSTEKLTVDNAFVFDTQKHSSCAYILVDLSTSMYSTFDLVKRNIVSYIESLSDDDKVILITFGETEVNTLLTGAETKEGAIDVVESLECNEYGTLFYEALSQAYKLSNASVSKYDREYVIAFSDGIDVQRGASTFGEVSKMYDTHTLPLYAACSYNASQLAADNFGELARVSGGDIALMESADDFDAFLSKINDVTVVKLSAATNHADGKEKQLAVKVGDSQVEINIPITRSIEDTDAPTVTDLHYDAEKDVFVLTLSEKVVGATSNTAYKITNENGEKLEVSEVFYSEIDNVYEIKTKDPIYIGTYTFEFSGIKDDSQEANALAEKQNVKVDKSNNVVEKQGISLWIIVLIVAGSLVLIGIVVLVIVLANKNKGGDDSSISNEIAVPVNNKVNSFEYEANEQEIVKHHIKASNSIKVRMKIQTGGTSEQIIETSVVSSLIVGRSDTCDVYIDDTKLSRQHFVIENDNGDFYVMDLQSRNGTMLNGIRINSRQRLSSGDKIMAGLSDIYITILGR